MRDIPYLKNNFPIAVIHNAFQQDTDEQTALKIIEKLHNNDIHVDALKWRLLHEVLRERKNLDRWCIVEKTWLEPLKGVNIHVQNVQVKDPERWLKEVEARVSDKVKANTIAGVKELIRQEIASEKQLLLGKDARKTIDELVVEMESAQRVADTLEHPQPRTAYRPHIVMTDDHRKAWKAKLAVKVHEAEQKEREKDRYQVLVDREFEEWE